MQPRLECLAERRVAIDGDQVTDADSDDEQVRDVHVRSAARRPAGGLLPSVDERLHLIRPGPRLLRELLVSTSQPLPDDRGVLRPLGKARIFDHNSAKAGRTSAPAHWSTRSDVYGRSQLVSMAMSRLLTTIAIT